MKLFGIEQKPVLSFAEPMTVASIGLLRFRRWNLGRLHYAEVGVVTPIGEVKLSGFETPDGNLPMVSPEPHLILHIGDRVGIRLA
jgi:hypothetical protein